MSHNNDNIITGLDIGSSNIRVVVGQRAGTPEDPRIRIIGAAEHPAEGISKGIITSIEDAVSSISTCLEQAERVTGVPIERVWVGISGNHISSHPSKGIIAISRTDGEIGEEDVERAIEAARAVATPPNYEIIHVIPRSFMVDNQQNISDPIGMTGIRLEVETQIIQGLSSQIKNLTKCVYRTGVEVEDMVLSSIAASEAVLSSREKELGVVLINIGATTTSLAVYEEGDILHTANLPLGSDHITSDIAIGLRINIDLAEKLKLKYGYAFAKDIERKEEINLSEFSDKEEDNQLVSKKYVASIIEARVDEIFHKIDQELVKINRSGKLPAGAILIGGGSKLPQITEIARKILRLPAGLGALRGMESAIDKTSDISFLPAVGLVKWGDQYYGSKGVSKKPTLDFSFLNKFFKKTTKGIKRLIP